MTNNHISISLAPAGGFKGLGNGPLANPGSDAINVFASFLSSVIGLMTIIAFIWFTFRFIIAAIQLMYAGGDKAHIETAKEKMKYAIIGVVVVVSAIFIINLVGSFMGLPNILDVGAMFELITN